MKLPARPNSFPGLHCGPLHIPNPIRWSIKTKRNRAVGKKGSRKKLKEKRDDSDITAAVKPEYPVVDRNPPFTKTVANFSILDYLRLFTITGVSVTVGYLSGIKPNIRGPSMVTGGLIGVMGGFMYAYQNSAGRLMGFFPNDADVARYKK